MTDIFLSYSREDQVVARRFAEGFEGEGLSVWWDQSLTPGEAFDQVTERALGEAKAVVVLWSKASVNSRWVRAEATQANADHRLVPVMIEHCKRPIMFELTHTADLSDWQGNWEDPEWQSFVANVRQFVRREGSGLTPLTPESGKALANVPGPMRNVRKPGSTPGEVSLIAGTAATLKRFIKFGTGIAIAIGLAAIAAGVAWKMRSPGDHEITRFSVDLAAPLESGESLALSPDGRRMVYAIGRQLYSRRLDQDQPTPIPGATNAQNPFFSPDGKSVAYFTPTQLVAFDFGSEAAHVIAEVKTAPGLVGCWDSEGRIFFGLGGAYGLYWVPAVGGVPEEFAKLAKYVDFDYPDVLPGGKWVLFTANVTAGDWSGSDIVAQNVANGERKIVLKGGHFARYIPTGHLLFARSGNLYAIEFDPGKVATRGRAVPVIQGVVTNELSGHAQFAFAANGTLIYVSGGPIGRSGEAKAVVTVGPGGESKTLTVDPRSYGNPRVSPDGLRIAVEVAGADKSVQIWVMEVATGTAAQLTFDGEENRFPVWTSDGREILFTSRRGKEFAIYRKAADGAGEAQRVVGGTSDLAPTDVRSHVLLFQDRIGAARDVMTLDLETQAPPRPLLATPNDESGARVSPGGAWVVYTATTPGTTPPEPRIFARPFPNAAGGQRAISDGAGIAPVWSSTGDEIYYIRFSGGPNSLVSVPVTVTSTTITPTGHKDLFSFSPRFDVVVSGTLHATPFEVLPKGGFVAVETTAPKAPQGSDAATNRPRINVVLNWVDELRRFAPAE